MTRHLYPFSDERSYFFDSLYDHNRLCHGSKTFSREPNKVEAKLESMFTIIQVLRTSAVGNAWCRGPLCAKVSQFHFYLPWGQRQQLAQRNCVLNVKGAFHQEKAIVGAFSLITNLRMDLRLKL